MGAVAIATAMPLSDWAPLQYLSRLLKHSLTNFPARFIPLVPFESWSSTKINGDFNFTADSNHGIHVKSLPRKKCPGKGIGQFLPIPRIKYLARGMILRGMINSNADKI